MIDEMATTGRLTEIDEGGVKKDAYVVAFTDEALTELQALQKAVGDEFDFDVIVAVAVKRLAELLLPPGTKKNARSPK